VTEDLRLAGVLETVLYYASDQQDEMERFYENVLGLVSLGWDDAASRSGSGTVWCCCSTESDRRDRTSRPPHGASGPIHAAFLAAPGEYEAWKGRLAQRGVELIDEIA